MSTVPAPATIQPINPQRVQLEKEKFDEIEKQYRATKFCKELEKRLKEEEWTIENIVIMGLGPTGESTPATNNPRFTHSDQTRWQLAHIRHIRDVISGIRGAFIDIYNQECYRAIFDDPSGSAWSYPPVFDTFLESLGIAIIKWPGSVADQYKPRAADELGDAPNYITMKTLFYAPFLHKDTTLRVIEQGVDPECYIGVSLDTLLRHETEVAGVEGREVSRSLRDFKERRVHRFSPIFDVEESDVGLLGALIWYKRRHECKRGWKVGDVSEVDEEARLKRLSMSPVDARKKAKEEFESLG
ncbi:hypothetical protein FKW77_005263 [Venturia effusa]|uniref:SRR1-like domain-containing protein n=1 Tax=Venturia effusa TaxID=50376 RepID=A0A517L1B0_9PEZI|nr:hypothetical protein FKW77_005263 [Venturia effusa]